MKRDFEFWRDLLAVFAAIVFCVCALAGVAWGAKAVEMRLQTNEQVVPHELVTMVAVAGREMQLCWKREPICPPGKTCKTAERVQWRWYRAEDGVADIGPVLPAAEWQPSGNLEEWCTNMTVPEPGHWIYEAHFCAGTTTEVCSERTSIGLTSDGRVDGLGVRRWWLYSYHPVAGKVPMWPPGALQVVPVL